MIPRRRPEPSVDAQWTGAYARYDLIKELAIALSVVTLLAIVLTILFSSPDDRPSTIRQWSHQNPIGFLKTAVAELGRTSDTAEYGPPLRPQRLRPARRLPLPAEMAGRQPPD